VQSADKLSDFAVTHRWHTAEQTSRR